MHLNRGLYWHKLRENLKSEADSHYGLALAYRLVNDHNASEEQLLLAKEIYQTLGSTEGVERVDNLLNQ